MATNSPSALEGSYLLSSKDEQLAPSAAPYPPPNSQGFFVPPTGQGSQPPEGFGPRTEASVPVNWMPKPSVQGCPAGLEYLTKIDQLLIKQQKELMEMMTNIETPNRYVCYNTMSQTVYYCQEESDFMAQQFQRSKRAFIMHIVDTTGAEVIRIYRPFKYQCLWECCSCSECCLDEVKIEAPIGQTIGFVKQLYKGCDIRYAIQDEDRNTILQIHGPSYCYCPCWGHDINFTVMSADGTTEVGKITRQWTNYVQNAFTNADNFSISFPLDLAVRVKATLIGAVFLIDFMFFEISSGRRNASYYSN